MRTTKTMWTAGLFTLLLAACGGAETMDDAAMDGEDAAMDQAPAEASGPLAGWEGRTDGGQPLEEVGVTQPAEGGWQVDTGPAVVLWQDGMDASGEYRLSGTFHQVSSKGNPHGTGLVFGGSEMDGAGQVYTYFMVRGTGDFLVKTRTGDETFWAEPTEGWVAHDAVNQTDANDAYTNELAVEVGATEVAFFVNGTEVLRRPAEGLYTDGNYGVRLNHNLTIRFSDLAVEAGM